MNVAQPERLLASSSRILCILSSLSVSQLALVILLLATSVIEASWTSIVIASAALFVFETTRRIVFTHLRVCYLRRIGLNASDIRYIDGPRDELHELQNDERTECRIRVADVLFRKGGHVVSLIVLFLFHRHIAEEAFIVALSLGSALMIGLQVATLKYDKSWWHILRYLYGASDRIRDGRLAKHNAMSASVALTFGIVTSYALGKAAIRTSDFDLASELVILPLTFGDALGEIIGTPFGRHRFKVIGFGEINQKSVEGCIAVCIGSFVPCTIASAISDIRAETWALPGIVALATTFVETISFRSTDNFTIPFVNSTILVLWTRFFNLV